MFEITVDETHAIVDFVLEGIVRVDEMERFVVALKQATLDLAGHEIKIKADLRGFRPAAPEVADMIRNVQEFGIRTGVKRVAEIVESDVVALQLNRVARGSGTDKILRRFWDEDSAREWLLYGDAGAVHDEASGGDLRSQSQAPPEPSPSRPNTSPSDR